jgi:hypothetical protein
VTCGPAEVCEGSDCVCATGNIVCGGVCVNPRTNEDHCGSCGNECAAGKQCVNRVCV